MGACCRNVHSSASTPRDFHIYVDLTFVAFVMTELSLKAPSRLIVVRKSEST
jgi:hypothetical protein